MKKLFTTLLAAVLAVACCFGLTACGGGNTDNPGDKTDDFKVGFIFLEDESSTYDKNFIDAMNDVVKELGLKDEQVVIRKKVEESTECTTAAEELVDEGCKVIFANSFGHGAFILPVAEANPDVQFCHATGDATSGENCPANFHNAFANIYEGRYLAGIAAGLKLKAMSDKAEDHVIGYVGAKPYAEVISGYTSFYLGAKFVCPDVTMKVKYTNSWYDPTAEGDAASALISAGCKLISQHADSQGAPGVCEDAGVPNVFYNGNNLKSCPNTYLASSKINWRPYMKYMIETARNGKTIDKDWLGTIHNGAVQACEEGVDLNTAIAAEGTAEEIARVRALMEAGTFRVFDCANFTVTKNRVINGATYNSTVEVDENGRLVSFMADAHADAAYTPDTNVVVTKDGVTYVEESVIRTAPYFNLIIDGIDLI